MIKTPSLTTSNNNMMIKMTPITKNENFKVIIQNLNKKKLKHSNINNNGNNYNNNNKRKMKVN